MKKALLVIWVVLLVAATVAIFTKPSYNESFLKISYELNSRGYLAGVYYKYDSINHHASSNLQTPVIIKDRLFYRDIYFPINGKTRRIAIAAFTKIFLID